MRIVRYNVKNMDQLKAVANEHLGGDGTMNKCRLCKNEEVKDHDYMSLATFFEDIDMVPDIYLCRSCLKRLIRRMTEFIQLITDNN